MDYLVRMDKKHNVNVGDLVLWDYTDPPVLGIVVEIFNMNTGHPFAGISVLWFGRSGENTISPCRAYDVKVLSSVQKKS
jgi:hypothetical protein